MDLAEPKIRVENIYYLLCYAWDKLEEREIVDVKEIGVTSLLNLFGRVLDNGITYVLSQGLDRAYVDLDGLIKGVRGKLDLTQTLKSGALNRNQTWCTYDELDYNVLHNQLLKSTLGKLVHMESIDNKMRGRLYSHYLSFRDVDEIQVSPGIFQRVRLDRNNYFYGFLLKVCEIIHEGLFFNEDDGVWTFREFDQNERQMRYLFQSFVRNFCRIELDCVLSKSRIQWQLAPHGDEAKKHLPQMYTDISLNYKGRHIIIDTKYYKKTLQFNRTRKTIYSNHLYQLYAYIKNSEEKYGSIEGILLYPVVSEKYHFQYSMMSGGHKMSVHTINLNQDHSSIGRDLKEIITQ